MNKNKLIEFIYLCINKNHKYNEIYDFLVEQKINEKIKNFDDIFNNIIISVNRDYHKHKNIVIHNRIKGVKI